MHTSYFCRVGQFYCGALVGGRPGAEFMSFEDRLSAAFPDGAGENSRYVTQSPVFTGPLALGCFREGFPGCGARPNPKQGANEPTFWAVLTVTGLTPTSLTA